MVLYLQISVLLPNRHFRQFELPVDGEAQDLDVFVESIYISFLVLESLGQLDEDVGVQSSVMFLRKCEWASAPVRHLLTPAQLLAKNVLHNIS